MYLQIGQMIHHDRYRIEALLGKGGMGAVYKAYDNSLHMNTAIKENLETSFEAQRQFEREANILAHLSHPNLPRVTDYFFIPDQGQYLVMDYVEGEDLESMTQRLGRLPEPEVLTWIGQISEALAYLHSQRPPIIHRDIKPSNIRIRPDGRAMLVDFGIAKIYDSHLATTIGAKAVTPGYSPPEQYGGGSTDTRSDIYALGATIFHLLTGQTPPDSLSRAINSATMPPPRQVNPAISPQVEQIVLKAVEIPTERRYQNINELSSDLLLSRTTARPAPAAETGGKPAEEYATRALEPDRIVPAAAVGAAVVQPLASPARAEPAEAASPAATQAQAYPAQTVVVPNHGEVQAGLPAAPVAGQPAKAQPASTAQPRQKIPTWLIIAGVLIAACLVFSIFGAGVFGILRGMNADRVEPSATTRNTPLAAVVEASPISTIAQTRTIPTTAAPTHFPTQKVQTQNTTNYSATMTLIGATRAASTSQAGVQVTQQAQHLGNALQKLAAEGKISSSAGTFHAIDDFEKEMAKINYFEWWNTDYSAEDFAIEADIAYDVASDKANWFNTGCGFVFSETEDDFFHFLKLSLDGMATLRSNKNADWGMIIQRKYGNPRIPAGELHALMVVKDRRVLLFVDDKPVFDISAPRVVSGPISLSLSSGINSGFGTRCKYSDIGLWIFE